MAGFNSRLIFLVAGPMTALIAAAGCAPGGATSDSQQSIVNGVTTWAHPEIGILRSREGGCTATLLSAHAGITAAHCIGYSNIDSIDALASFEIFDTNGISMGQWSIDRATSFTTEDYTWIDDYNTTDVAIFHLASEVSSLIATPGSVASAPPEPGDLASVYGYGCTQRFIDGSFGTKRYVPFTYATQTGTLCFGDSGGPAVRGNLQAPISVWGVNSGWTSGDTTHDFWGGAFYFKHDIAGTLANWNHIVEPWIPAQPVIFG
jgi:hypothetical protein